MDLYNLKIDGDVAASVTTAVGGRTEVERNCLSATLKIRGGCDRDRYGKKAGKGALVQWELSGTLGVSQDQTLFVWSTAYRGGQNIDEVTRTWSE